MNRDEDRDRHRDDYRRDRRRRDSDEDRRPRQDPDRRSKFSDYRRDDRGDDTRVKRSRFSNKNEGEYPGGSRFGDGDDGRRKRNKWGDAADFKGANDGKSDRLNDVIRSTNPALSLNGALGVSRGDCSQLRRKLYLPQDGVNYIGLLIGPKGMFQKKLEGESGCKILIRGKGSQKEGQPPQPDEDDDQHVLIMGDSQGSVDLAVEACNKIILADEGTRNMIRKEQLKVAAELNNTIYSSNDNKAPVDESMLTPYGPPSPYAYIVPVPNDCIGLIIGKKGETIRRLQLDSGAKIQVAKKEVEETGQRYVFVEGPEDKYLHAKQLIDEVVDEWRRIHQRPEIPLESKPVGGPSQTVPIPNHLIPFLTGERRDRNDPKCPDIIPIIHDKYNVKVYIADSSDHSGNRNVEVSGEPDKVACALDEMFNFLREREPGTNLMMNPLYYASAMGWQKYSDFAYPGEVQRGQNSHPPHQQNHGYPPQYPPHGYQGQGQHQHPGYQGGHPGQEGHHSHGNHPEQHQQPQHHEGYGHHQPQSNPHSQPNEHSRSQENKPAEENKDHPKQDQSNPHHQPAHQYAEHYSKSLGGEYQYYYDYYMKQYANAPAPGK